MSRSGGVFRFVTERPVAVAMAFVTLVAFGWQSLNRLPMSLLPDISYPTVTVRAEYPGAAPEDVEERVTKRLQEALAVLPRLENISSISRAERCDITLEFSWGTPLTFAIQDVGERIDRTTLLPQEMPPPLILRYDPSLDPVLVVALTGGRDLAELRRLAEDRLATALATIDGVAAVRVRGGLSDEIQVRLLPERLATFGLRPNDISDRLAAENVNLASGLLVEGDTEYLVRILNEYLAPEEIAHTILSRSGDSIVRLGDVAQVVRTTRERDAITRVGGRESVELQVFREADANIVKLAGRVRQRLLGSEAQRAHVRKLRAGELPDPEVLLAEFRAEADADPARAAALARVLAARSSAGEPGDRGGPGQAPAEADTRSAEERLLDAELSARLATIREAQRQRSEAFDYLAAALPGEVTVHLLSDQSRFIRNALDEVRDAALFGALLSVLVLYLFLRKLGPTLIIAVSIPVSVVCSFTPLLLSGTSLNVMSLGGLALGIGMLVDNAIVVLEAIARRVEEGLPRREAAVVGTREVAMAVTASTLTTVAVFAPIVFVDGIAGQVFRDQSLTVVVSLLASLVSALFLVPMLASRGEGLAGLRFTPSAGVAGWFAVVFRRALAGWPELRRIVAGPRRLVALLLSPLSLLQLLLDLLGRILFSVVALLLAVVGAGLWLAARGFQALMALPCRLFASVWEQFERRYPPLVRRMAMSAGGRSLVLALSLLLLLWTGFAATRLGSELLPAVHQGEIIARFALPVGAPLESTAAVADIAERELLQRPDVAWVSTLIGVPRDEYSQPDEGSHSVRMVIGLTPTPDMQAAEERLMAELRERLSRLPALREPPRFERPALFSIRSPIVVEIKGDNLAELATAAEQLTGFMSTLPGLRDVRSSVQPGGPEVMLSFDRDLLSRRGLDTRTLADSVAGMVAGRVATRFTDRQHKLDVLVGVDRGRLTSVDELLALPANPADAAPEPISALVQSRIREGPREIRRIWGQRAALVSANLAGFDVGRATAAIVERVPEFEQLGALTIDIGGQGREMQGALAQMLQALLLAVFLVYVVMASIFESLLQPFIILVTVPLALFGAVSALWLLDLPLSVVVFLGAIILAGIVVNNAIVLIDAINRRRREQGLELGQALAESCRVRARPILMTTLTTVLGLLPLTGWLPGTGSEGSELRAPMAVTVVAGLSAATLLTLFVIPTLYAAVEAGLERLAARRTAR